MSNWEARARKRKAKKAKIPQHGRFLLFTPTEGKLTKGQKKKLKREKAKLALKLRKTK